MKNNSKMNNRFITFLFSMLLIGLIAVGCSDDDDPAVVQQDLVELAVASGYNTLAAALTEANLITALGLLKKLSIIIVGQIIYLK